MKQTRIVKAFVMSLVVSGGCTWLLSRKLSERAVPIPVPDAMYAAPSRSLRAGEILKVDNVKLVPWPASRALGSAFLKTTDVIGRSVLYPLEEGEPILARDLAVSGAGVGLSAKIPDGMRAIALRSDEVAGVAGFLNPGSHVDVLATYRTSQSPDPLTATVLQDSQVVAVGQRAQPDPEGKPVTVTVVTLLLTPEEAERAVLASTQGTVHFLLRNSADAVHTQSSPMLLSMLSGVSAPHPARLAVPSGPVSPSKSNEIETVLGNESDPGKSEKGQQP